MFKYLGGQTNPKYRFGEMLIYMDSALSTFIYHRSTPPELNKLLL